MTEVDPLSKRFVSNENETVRWLSPVQTDCRVSLPLSTLCLHCLINIVRLARLQARLRTGPPVFCVVLSPFCLLYVLTNTITRSHAFFPPTWWNQFVGYLIVSSRMLNRRVFSSFVLPDLGLEYFCRRYCPPSTLSLCRCKMDGILRCLQTKRSYQSCAEGCLFPLTIMNHFGIVTRLRS